MEERPGRAAQLLDIWGAVGGRAGGDVSAGCLAGCGLLRLGRPIGEGGTRSTAAREVRLVQEDVYIKCL